MMASCAEWLSAVGTLLNLGTPSILFGTLIALPGELGVNG